MGTIRCCKFDWKKGANANFHATAFSCLGGCQLSGPYVLLDTGIKVGKPAVLILRSGISGNCDFPLSVMLIVGSCVNTDLSCSTNVSTYSLSVVHSFLAMIVGIPMFSVGINLT